LESQSGTARSSYARITQVAIPRDLNDWETVAISILLDVDIWTKDSDFIGCGRATWTTDTLIY